MLLASTICITVMTAPPQWSDVAPILTRSCTPCHAGDGAGAYPLASPAELRRKRTTVAEVLADHSMPPWLPSQVDGTFLHELKISDADRELLKAWVADGCQAPSDDARTKPVPRSLTGKVSASADVASQWTAGREERDAMRSFAVPLNNAEPLRISGLYAHFVKPGHVGHVTFAADSSGEAERLDALDGASGFKLAGDIGNVSSGSLLGVGADGWFELPHGYCIPVPKHATLVAEVHASGRGRVEDAGFALELFEAPADAIALSAMPVGSHGSIRLPSKTSDTIVAQTVALEHSYEIVAAIARPGRLATALDLTVQAQGASEARALLTIPRYNGHRDRPYAFAKPVRVERGSRLQLTTTFETPLAATQSTPECVLLLHRIPSDSTSATPATPVSLPSTPEQQACVQQFSLLPCSAALRVLQDEVSAKQYALLLDRPCLPQTSASLAAGATYFDAALWCNAASAAIGKQPCYLITQPQHDDNGHTVSALVQPIEGDGFRLPTSSEWSEFASLSEIRNAAGGVWEWCEDSMGEERVVRGASWADPEARRRVETLESVPPSATSELFGFRAVMGPRAKT